MSRRAAAYNGGNWDNGANAGLFYLNVNNAPSNANTNIGARLANENGQMSRGSWAGDQRPFFGAAVPTHERVEDEQAWATTVAHADLSFRERICDPENLYRAYADAKRGKRYTPESLHFARQAERAIATMRAALWSGAWQPGEPRRFTIWEPKRREIVAPPFADRIVHHAIVQIIEPLFERRFICDSYACRVGKGTHAAVARVQSCLRRAKRRWGDRIYVVKVDVRKYFASINHDIAISAIERVTDDPWLIDLFARILRGYGFDQGTGIPVGALTSQLLANVVLDILDHRVKDLWGEPYYVRYMDDAVLIARDKTSAQYRLNDIKTVLHGLALQPNPKSTIFPWQRGVDFAGYRTWPTHILPRKRTMRRWRKTLASVASSVKNKRLPLQEYRNTVISCIAYTKHCSAFNSLSKTLQECVA